MSNIPVKLTPLYGIAQRLNAQFAEYHGWKIPEVYTTQGAEINAAQNGVALADETPNGKLIVESSQAEVVLNTVFSHCGSEKRVDPSNPHPPLHPSQEGTFGRAKNPPRPKATPSTHPTHPGQRPPLLPTLPTPAKGRPSQEGIFGRHSPLHPSGGGEEEGRGDRGGDCNPQSEGRLSTLAINAGMVIGSTRRYRLRNDLFFVSTPPGEEVAMQKELTAAAKGSGRFLTVTDVTHGRAEIRVIGPASQDLLSKLCGLNFQTAAFPNNTAKQSSLAKTTQLIIRRDIGEAPAFSIIGARSMGAYIWETLMEAGREWGVVPIGCAALNTLEISS
jgi:heterotetrameric sarcosine oxidase gamma subunit